MLWEHQSSGIEQFFECVGEGYQTIALTSPTGMGKTLMVAEIIRQYASGEREELPAPVRGGSQRFTLLYTGRPGMMLDQLSRDMADHGLDFSIRSAARSVTRQNATLTIASLPTDKARTTDVSPGEKYDLVVVDEGHLHCKGAGDVAILNRHKGRGAVILKITATPVGMGGTCQKLVVAGTVDDGFRCGALVRARHYGPDEPALASFQEKLDQKLSEKETVSAIMRPGVFGRVLDHYARLNPRRLPAILFAPGVKESRWFAQKFFEAGVTAAAIDGEEVWINGEQVERKEGRAEVARGSEDGSIEVVTNRFVLREGVNWPWLYHGIFATVFDSVASYLQAGGRILRAHPSVKSVVIQDHGGNWRRHGSLNESREWSLDFGSSNLARLREAGYRDPDAPPERKEPMTCPQCKAVLVRPPCTVCEFDFPESSRTREVVQVDGTLVRIKGSMFYPRSVRLKNDTVAKWRQVYFSYKNSKRRLSLSAAYGYFFTKYGYWPPRNLPWMPLNKLHWERLVRQVERHELYPDPLYSGDRSVTGRRKKKVNPTKSLFEES